MEGRDKERDRTVVVKGPQETKLAALGRFGSVQPAVALVGAPSNAGIARFVLEPALALVD